MIDVRLSGERMPSSGALRVLFDCPAAWPVLCPEAERGVGGAEVRSVTFARELARRGEMDVHFLVREPGRTFDAHVDGITVHFESRFAETPKTHLATWRHGARRLSDRLAGSLAKRLSGTPERHPFVTSLEYDVLCCFGVTNRTASLVRSTRQAGRRVVVFLTSDRTLEDVKLQGRRHRGVYGELGVLCRYALRSADAVVVQKRSQQDSLRRSLGIHAQVIRNPIALQPVADCLEPATRPASPYVLWVGRADTFSKRADRCWELARQCPTVPFVVIMNRHEQATFEQLEMSRPANVTLIPHVRPTQIEAYYREATLLINTSDSEGFPNSFLQAGKYGVPILSLKEDPDGMLGRNQAGVCCYGSLTTMREHLLQLMKQGPDYQRMSRKSLSYTQTFHGLSERCDELSRLVGQVGAAKRTAA